MTTRRHDTIAAIAAEVVDGILVARVQDRCGVLLSDEDRDGLHAELMDGLHRRLPMQLELREPGPDPRGDAAVNAVGAAVGTLMSAGLVLPAESGRALAAAIEAIIRGLGVEDAPGGR